MPACSVVTPHEPANALSLVNYPGARLNALSDPTLGLGDLINGSDLDFLWHVHSLKIITILVKVKRYLLVVLVCSSLMTNDVEHSSRANMPLVFFIWRNSYTNLYIFLI